MQSEAADSELTKTSPQPTLHGVSATRTSLVFSAAVAGFGFAQTWARETVDFAANASKPAIQLPKSQPQPTNHNHAPNQP